MSGDINDMSLEEAITKIHRDSPYPESALAAEMNLREADAIHRCNRSETSRLLLGLTVGLVIGFLLGLALAMLFHPKSKSDSQHSPRQRSEHSNYSYHYRDSILLSIQSAKPFEAGQDGLRTIGRIFRLPGGKLFIRHAHNDLAVNAHEITDVAGFPDIINHI